MTKRIRVALVNDYPVVVAGLASLLEPYQREVMVVDLAVRRPTRRTPIDVALYDTYGRSGFEPQRACELIAQQHVHKVAVYSFDRGPDRVAEAMAAGADGYVWKGCGSRRLVQDLRQIAGGDQVIDVSPHRGPRQDTWPGRAVGLTRRESEVLALLSQGMTNREIGAALFLGDQTVKTHVSSLLRKLRVPNRGRAAAFAAADPEFRRQIHG